MVPRESWHAGSKLHRRPIDLGTKYLEGSSIPRIPAPLAYRVPGNPARRGIIDTQDPSSLGASDTLGSSHSRGQQYPGSKLPGSRGCLGIKSIDGSRHQVARAIMVFNPAPAAWFQGPMGVRATRRPWKDRDLDDPV